MKDFYDIWVLSRLFSFEGKVLRQALENTFERRRTAFPPSTPFALTPAFYEDPQKTAQWTAFVKRSKPDMPVGDISAVITDIAFFIVPVIESLHLNAPFEQTWQPDRGWEFQLQGQHPSTSVHDNGRI